MTNRPRYRPADLVPVSGNLLLDLDSTVILGAKGPVTVFCSTTDLVPLNQILQIHGPTDLLTSNLKMEVVCGTETCAQVQTGLHCGQSGEGKTRPLLGSGYRPLSQEGQKREVTLQLCGIIHYHVGGHVTSDLSCHGSVHSSSTFKYKAYASRGTRRFHLQGGRMNQEIISQNYATDKPMPRERNIQRGVLQAKAHVTISL